MSCAVSLSRTDDLSLIDIECAQVLAPITTGGDVLFDRGRSALARQSRGIVHVPALDDPSEPVPLRFFVDEWRDVVGYEGRYQVSRTGQVWTTKNAKLLRPSPQSRGYLSVNLYDGSTPKRPRNFCVHDLVCAAFHGPKPIKYTVDHVDTRKRNNRASNLEYVTYSVNIKRANANGIHPHAKGEDAHNAKLSAGDVRTIRHECETNSYHGQFRDLGQRYNVSPDVISFVAKRKTYKNVT